MPCTIRNRGVGECDPPAPPSWARMPYSTPYAWGWSRCPRPFSRLIGHFVGCAYHWLKGTSEAGFGDGISIFRRISPAAMRLRATEMLPTLMMDTPGSWRNSYPFSRVLVDDRTHIGFFLETHDLFFPLFFSCMFKVFGYLAGMKPGTTRTTPRNKATSSGVA